MSSFENINNVPEYIKKRLLQIKHIVLDLDGTIYTGDRIFPYTKKFLNTLSRLNIGFSFLTNNSSKNSLDILGKLQGMGLNVSIEDLFTSADATIYYIKNHYPEWRRLFILGTSSLIKQFENSGYIVINEKNKEEPDALIVSFDMSLTYDKLCTATWWAQKGKPYLSTNPDFICPTDLENTVLVDCGAICACIEAASGRKPDKVLGKPQIDMMTKLLYSKKLLVSEVAIVGDRVYTDMLTASNVECMGILVLSGETVLNDINERILAHQSDLILPSIEHLGDIMYYLHKCNM